MDDIGPGQRTSSFMRPYLWGSVDFMKIHVAARLVNDSTRGYLVPIVIGEGPTARTHLAPAPPGYDPQAIEPTCLGDLTSAPNSVWLFRNSLVLVQDALGLPESEVILRIKHAVLRQEQALRRIAHQVEGFENMERVSVAQRGRIPEAVRLFVWQRDEGKCVKCGARAFLEFDHIIPVAKGGANTERNIQLLCESCNRSKGATI
jgi:hypothetical protein